jgi:hypothetical protein
MYHNNGTAINKQVEAEGRTSPATPYEGLILSD